MMFRGRLAVAGLALAGTLASWAAVPAARAAAELPASLTDQEFWSLSDSLSEPDGAFNSDNLLSNETTFQYVVPRLKATIKPGGAYVGVGPEQNFTYIVALEPKIAFITDIRRGNLQAHLMYKAIFEMSADRADFLALLFSRKRPAGLGPESTVDQLMTAYERAEPSQDLFLKNLDAIKKWLSQHHGFKLRADDLPGVEYVYSSFYAGGPGLSYNSNRVQRNRYPSYSELQRETDGQGQARGYVASEANFRAMKQFEERNLLVPLVGDFAGPKALRGVGTYLKDHGATVTAFYASNVENYLFQDGHWGLFAANVATMPLDATSTFIRACFDSCPSVPGSRSTTLLDPIQALLKDVAAGRIRGYFDVLTHSR